MCVYIYVYTHIYTYTYVLIIYVYMYVCICICVYEDLVESITGCGTSSSLSNTPVCSVCSIVEIRFSIHLTKSHYGLCGRRLDIFLNNWSFIVDSYNLDSVVTWWRHQMEIFSALLAVCGGNSPVAGEFPSQRLVTRSFDVFFDLHLNKRLNK